MGFVQLPPPRLDLALVAEFGCEWRAPELDKRSVRPVA